MKRLSVLIAMIMMVGNGIAQDGLKISKSLNILVGQNAGFEAEGFIDTYNNPLAYPRPLLPTEKRIDEFEPFKRELSWAVELNMKINRKYVIGVYFQYQGKNYTDSFRFPGLYGFDNMGEPIIFDVKDVHSFETRFIPVMLFADYRLFTNSLLTPVVGIGAGFAITSFKWDWKSNGDLYDTQNSIHYYIREDKNFLDVNRKIFIFQPRLKLEMNFLESTGDMGDYFDNIYLQIDYIFANDSYDFFDKFNDEYLALFEPDELPGEMSKLYEKYDVSWGGLQVMFGLSIKLY